MALELPPDLVEKAAKELNETPENRAAGLQALQDYYEAHPEERPHRTDAPYLLMFLRHAKFDVARARGRIAALERWLKECSKEIGDIASLRGEMFVDMFKMGFVSFLGDDRRSREGAAIQLLRPRNMEPLADPGIILRWNAWLLYRAVHNPYIQVCGEVVLESCSGFSLMHNLRFQQIPSSVLRRYFKFGQECMPFRIRGIYFVHQPKWIGLLFAIAKPFLSAKLRSRIRMFGSDLAALHELIDPRVLPPELGGSDPDTGDKWFSWMLEMEAEEAREKEAREKETEEKEAEEKEAEEKEAEEQEAREKEAEEARDQEGAAAAAAGTSIAAAQEQ